MSGCRAPAFGCVVLHVWLSCSRLRMGGASWLAVVLPSSGVGLHGWLLCSQLSGVWASWLAVVLPASGVRGFMACYCARAPGVGGASRPPTAYCSRAPRTGVQPDSSARRRKHVNVSLLGFFLIGYSSICQLFKFSYRLLYAKVFRGENFIKTLFSINYRGYFIIQAAHSAINYSYFLHKTDIKHVENQ